MNFLRQIFKPSQGEVWQQLSREIGAEYIDGGIWRGDTVRAHVGEWTITLDCHSTGGKHGITRTRLRAPYVNRDGFRFAIYRDGMLWEVGAFLGLQDVVIGEPEFDREFVIKATDEAKVRALLANARLRHLIQVQPDIHLEIKDDEGWFGASFPEGVDELHFQAIGRINDLERLRSLYELFAETLNQLCHIGSAYQDDPRLVL